MAQSINDIYANLLDAKTRIPELQTVITGAVASSADLSALNSPSATAVWRLWAFIVACVIWLHEQLWTMHKAAVDLAITDGLAGTDRWLVAQAKKWQYGDPLLIDALTLKPYYAVDHPNLRLVTAAACQTRGGAAVLKVAKTVSGDLAPLSVGELAAFDAYTNDIQMAGSNIIPESRAADLLQLTGSIYYDANYTAADMRTRTEAAILAFLRDAIPFNGAFYLQRLTDAVQAVPGAVDAEWASVLAASAVSGGGGPVFAPTGRLYYPLAGYLRIDGGTPLSGSLTFTPAP